MTSSSIPATHLKTVLQNGVGRYVCPLKRLTIQFCKENQGSRGVRDFIQFGLPEFSRVNPGVAVYAEVQRNRAPLIIGEYLSGDTHQMQISKMSPQEVEEWVDYMRTRSGLPLYRFKKRQHTHNPSIQGMWTPETNRDPRLNITTFPDADVSRARTFKPSATEILREAADRSDENDDSNIQ